MTKNQAISAMILQAIEKNGGDLRAAIDSIFGIGAYEKIAGDVYEAIKQRNQA